jgi:DNA-binding transcriptional LysR family regulator
VASGSAATRMGRSAGGQPTPDELRAFLRLSEDPHFGRTARRIGVAQSSLSGIIRRLEAKLDVVLFERSSRWVELTEAGAELVPYAREVLERLDAVNAAAAPPRPKVEQLRVGIEGHGFAELNRPILSAQVARHPGARLVVQECPGMPQSFLDGHFDVALLRTPLEDERIQVLPVATEARGLIVPADHPAAGTDGASICDFLDEPFIELGPAVPRTRDYWLASECRGGEPPRLGGEASTTADALLGIAHTGLVTTGVRSFVRAFPASGIAFVATTNLTANTLSVATRANERRQVVTEFVDIVRAVLAGFAGLAPEIRPLPGG